MTTERRRNFPPLSPRTVLISLVLASTVLLALPACAAAAGGAKRLSTNPTSLSFGNQTVGTSSSTQTVMVTNTGSKNVTVQSVTVSNSAFVVSGWKGQITLAPSGSLQLGVAFKPTAQGSASGTLSITGTGANGSVSLSGTGVTSQPSTISVAISPTSAAIQTGASQQFAASVSGSTNTAVTWWVNGVQGGNSTVGTVSSAGLYVAPAAVPSGGSVTVTAQSSADSTKKANATVSIMAAPATVAVSISPTTSSLQTGASQQFTASVTGTTNTSVTWSVNGVQGGNSTIGTITSAGLYTTPATVPSGGSVTVTATSVYDSTKSASAGVTITAASTPVSVSISPTSASLQTGQSKQFTATVSGTTNTSVTWLVSGVQGGNSTVGTISSSGMYTAPATPPSGGSATVTAKSTYDTTKSANAAVTITAPSTTTLRYYVATTGSDSNDGLTPQTAWKTIQHAASSIQLGSSGTVVHVAPGTYTGSISTSKAGSATARIRYISDSKWGARLTGGSSVMWSVHGSYTDIVGFEFDGSVYSSCCAVATYSTTNVWILNNKIHDTAKSGNTTSNAVILLNADISSSSITTSKNVVDGNLIYHNNGGATGSTPNNGGQHGIYSQAAGDIIRNNIVLDQGGGWCIVSWHKVSNWTVVNNTMANCPNGGIDVGDDTATGVVHNNDTIVNNIVVNSGNSTTNNGGIDFRQCGSGNVVQNNLMYGNIPANYVGSCGGATLSGTQSGSNFTTFNNYTGTGSGDYRYPSGSTAIDHGTTSCASGASPCVPNNDADGGARPQGAAIDIGSYESGAVPATWPW